MTETGDTRTSPTLLGRLQANPMDEAAWREFENRYSEMVRSWCRRWGMQPSDADDLTQDVLVMLSKQMRHFEYDASRRFRGWLKTIAHRTWCDFLEAQRRRALVSGETAVMDLLEREDVQQDFFAELDQEWRREIMEAAMKEVQLRVQPHTWEAFCLLTHEGLSGADVANRLQMNIGAVWVAGSKVRKMIRQEVDRLRAEEDPNDEAS